MKYPSIKEKVYHVIYGTDTPAGKGFDILLLWLILISILVVCLESIPKYQDHYLIYFQRIEWVFTIFFTLEYILRIYSHPKPAKYIASFYGIIDLLSIFPTYLTLFVPGLQYLMTVRILRLLRIFRILKLTSFIHNAQLIKLAILASFQKLTVFILAVLSLVLIIGTIIYVVEGPDNGFTSIPLSIYWTIVTITTVGYGDITPQTALGQIISSVVMLLGYALIAVPTGIVTVELAKSINPPAALEEEKKVFPCQNCKEPVRPSFNFCAHCGCKVGN